MTFPQGLSVQVLEINRDAWSAVLLSGDDHLGAPSDGCAYRDRSNDSPLNVIVWASFDFFLPVVRDWDKCVQSMWDCIWFEEDVAGFCV